ncbi:MAG: TonB-dependent receptor [Candidatus Andeanibacterium colombiense]|uniref:TonB-dependent receptor n=1 Tax=Candidatus Andeanibacterium colombiense TaxID=3121345 RepID=A0AAJ6BLL3_9SPHN|nr:MAG: TonB-dependent receptor [Sphingomonadaceae bacterium]
MKTRYFAYLLSATILATLPLAPAAAQGDGGAQQQSRSFSIPAGRLSQGVLTLSEQAGVQIVFDSDTTASVAGNAVTGTMPLGQALDRLVSGTGLSWRWLKSGVVTIEGASGADGEVVTGAVNVEGVQGSPYFGGAGQAAGVNGVNGSRDITATEGTGSFTSGALTIGSKVPQALKDVPQSISVLTSERLEQQNITDITQAMRQLPGVTLVQGSTSLENTFYSRGFAIQSFQVDGGAPLVSSATGFDPQIDMSIYDHVEILRGADGQFNFYGDPGGTVNLVRKKPLDHPQFMIDAQLGSWQSYRVVADATSPLALDGALRGRLVMTYQDNDHFYDTARDNKVLLYGITELDATPTTLLTVGADYTKQDSVPWMNGLPRYQTGAELHLPRSTCLCFDWNRQNFDTTEIFGGMEQKLFDDWTAKVNLTYNRQTSTQKVGYSIGAVNPENDTGPMIAGLYTDFASKQFSAEATVNGSFELFGQRQEVTIGASRVDSNSGGYTGYGTLIDSSAAMPYQPYPGGPEYCYAPYGDPCPAGSITPARPPIDVFDFDPANPLYTEPRNSLPFQRSPKLDTVQSGGYLNLRLTAFEQVHLTTGIHWSRTSYDSVIEDLCTDASGSCASEQIGDVSSTTSTHYSDSNFSWPPAVNLSFDITKQLTAYVGYTDIYQSQATSLGENLKPIAPVTGSNWEGGFKWAARGGRLNLSLAAYRIKQSGFGTLGYKSIYVEGGQIYLVLNDGQVRPYRPDAYHTCCFVSDPGHFYKSQGIDLDLTGEVLPGWQVSASYTYNENKREGSIFGTASGTPLLSIQPKHLYKFWTSYDFGAAGKQGVLGGLAVSIGVNGQSSGYYKGDGCEDAFIVTDPTTGFATCGDGGSYEYSYTVPAYAVFSARIDYRLSDRWSLALNLENIFDKTYYQTVSGGVTGGDWYGAPRSFTASLRAKW